MSYGFCEMSFSCCLAALWVFISQEQGSGGNSRTSEASSGAWVRWPLHLLAARGPLLGRPGTVLPSLLPAASRGCGWDPLPQLCCLGFGFGSLRGTGKRQHPPDCPASRAALSINLMGSVCRQDSCFFFFFLISSLKEVLGFISVNQNTLGLRRSCFSRL